MRTEHKRTPRHLAVRTPIEHMAHAQKTNVTMNAPANRCLCVSIHAHIWDHQNQSRVETHVTMLNSQSCAFRFLRVHMGSNAHVQCDEWKRSSCVLMRVPIGQLASGHGRAWTRLHEHESATWCSYVHACTPHFYKWLLCIHMLSCVCTRIPT